MSAAEIPWKIMSQEFQPEGKNSHVTNDKKVSFKASCHEIFKSNKLLFRCRSHICLQTTVILRQKRLENTGPQFYIQFLFIKTFAFKKFHWTIFGSAPCTSEKWGALDSSNERLPSGKIQTKGGTTIMVKCFH